ncbi:MAG TPA: metallopeptidase family protein [Candidatus Omnitrophota bacterium]|nr:metallopeptidase family protein [Candidatus Omnitrophota bacterium]
MRKKESQAGEFEALVRDAVKNLPGEFKRRLENINIVIQEEPSVRQKKESGTGTDEELLGLYEGVPLGQRTHHSGDVLPDKITIFRGPVTRSCRNRREMRAAVRDTVLHEFAHYFGISDEHMLKTGTY